MPGGAVAPFSLSTCCAAILCRAHSVRAGNFCVPFGFAVVSLPAPARAWGCEGHQVVALLAEKHLTPHALAMAKKILADGPHRSEPQPLLQAGRSRCHWRTPPRGPMTFARYAPKRRRGITSISLSAQNIRDVEKYCDPKEGCVTRAITDQLAILRSRRCGSPEEGRRPALPDPFCGRSAPAPARRNEQRSRRQLRSGGVLRRPAPIAKSAKRKATLRICTACGTQTFSARATAGKTVDQVAAELDRILSEGKLRAGRKARQTSMHGPGKAINWRRKRYTANCRSRIPVEAPQPVMSCTDDNHIAARMLKLNERLEEPYQNIAVPIVRQRLAQAGARLALLLNQLWP